MVTSDLMTTQDAAKRLGNSAAYVRYLALTGQLPYSKAGRMYLVRRVDVEAFKNRRELKRRQSGGVQG